MCVLPLQATKQGTKKNSSYNLHNLIRAQSQQAQNKTEKL